jgi:hypothetical protein
MLIVGQESRKEESQEITFIIKLLEVGQRARYLAQDRNKNKYKFCILFFPNTSDKIYKYWKYYL